MAWKAISEARGEWFVTEMTELLNIKIMNAYSFYFYPQNYKVVILRRVRGLIQRPVGSRTARCLKDTAGAEISERTERPRTRCKPDSSHPINDSASFSRALITLQTINIISVFTETTAGISSRLAAWRWTSTSVWSKRTSLSITRASRPTLKKWWRSCLTSSTSRWARGSRRAVIHRQGLCLCISPLSQGQAPL